MNLVPNFVRVFKIDRVYLKQRKITLAFARTADEALDGVASTQAKPANLRRRHINIIWSGQIVGVWRAQKPETIEQDFDHTLTNNFDLFAGELFQNCEHQLLFAHDGGVFDLMLLCEAQQFGGCL